MIPSQLKGSCQLDSDKCSWSNMLYMVHSGSTPCIGLLASEEPVAYVLGFIVESVTINPRTRAAALSGLMLLHVLDRQV